MTEQEFKKLFEKYAEGVINEIIEPKLKKFESLASKINKSIGQMEEVATKNADKLNKELKKRQKLLLNTQKESESIEQCALEVRNTISLASNAILDIRDNLKQDILSEVKQSIKDINDDTEEWMKNSNNIVMSIQKFYQDMEDFNSLKQQYENDAISRMKSKIDAHIPLVISTMDNMIKEKIRVQTRKFMKDNGLIS